MSKEARYETEDGTPQGGVISPILCNMALDGLEELVVPASRSRGRSRLHVIRYADDFFITGKSPAVLEHEIRRQVEQFLAQRGLQLSTEKTRISHIGQGFNFLGFHYRKYRGTLLVQPQHKTVRPENCWRRCEVCWRSTGASPSTLCWQNSMP